MDGDPSPVATTKQNATETTIIDQLQHLISSAVREGLERIRQELQGAQDRAIKELQEKLERISLDAKQSREDAKRSREDAKQSREDAKQSREDAKQSREDVKHLKEEVKEARGLMNKVLECLETLPRTTTTYATVASSNLPIQPRHANGGTTSRGSIPLRAIPQIANPRAETDIKVWIKNDGARTRLSQTTSGQMVGTINKWLETEKLEGRAVAAKQVRDGNVIIATEDGKNKQELLRNTGWLQTLDAEAQVATPTHTILIHGVRIKSINMEEPEQAIEMLRAENAQLLADTKIKKISWSKTPLSPGKAYTSIVIGLESPSAANRAIEKGIILEQNVHGCELFDNNCRRKQCFHCQKYGHISVGCRRPRTCNYCAGHHASSECEIRGKRETPVCAACGESGHPSWDRNCKESMKEDSRIRIALNTRPMLYNEEEERQVKTNDIGTKSRKGSIAEEVDAPAEFSFIPPKKGRGRPRSPTKPSTQAPERDEAQPTPNLDPETTPTLLFSSQGRARVLSAKAQENEWETVSNKKRKCSLSPAKERSPLGTLNINTGSASRPQTSITPIEIEEL